MRSLKAGHISHWVSRMRFYKKRNKKIVLQDQECEVARFEVWFIEIISTANAERNACEMKVKPWCKPNQLAAIIAMNDSLRNNIGRCRDDRKLSTIKNPINCSNSNVKNLYDAPKDGFLSTWACCIFLILLNFSSLGDENKEMQRTILVVLFV